MMKGTIYSYVQKLLAMAVQVKLALSRSFTEKHNYVSHVYNGLGNHLYMHARRHMLR